MTLKQLQAEWLSQIGMRSPADIAKERCAEALTPHILQQERDMDLIHRLYDALPLGTNDIAITKLWGEVRSRLKEMG